MIRKPLLTINQLLIVLICLLGLQFSVPYVVDESLLGVVKFSIYIMLILLLVRIFIGLKEKNKAQHQIESMYESAHSVLWLRDSRTNELLRVSSYVSEIFGYTSEELVASPTLWYERIHPNDRKRYSPSYWQKKIERDGNVTIKYRIIQKNGKERWVQDQIYPIYSENGSLMNIGGIVTDITKEEQAAEEVRFLYFNDPVSEFANYESLKYTLFERIKYGEPFGFYILKVNRLNFIRKHIDQEIAEEVIRLLAKRFKSLLSPNLYIARISDSRFAIIDRKVRPNEQTIKMIRFAIKTIEQSIKVDQYEFFLTATVGVTHFHGVGETVKDLQKNAQHALEHARENHQPFAFFHKSMNTRPNEAMRIEADLRKSIDQEELLLYYQPKLNIQTGDLVGVEALVRWNHPSGRMISPGEFIPIAERTGLILLIGEWVIEQACIQMRKWTEEGIHVPSISVNLSVSQLFQHNLIEKIEQFLKGNDLEPNRLELEITETMAMDKGSVQQILMRIKKLGVSISIDDFGTGYSSLNQLRDLPIDIVKVDGSFVSDITTNEKANALLSSVIKMTKLLKLKVVVEGVETEEQLNKLYENECEVVQGFVVSKPISAEEIVAQKEQLKCKLKRLNVT
ncbi:bifunctional diguanylate cyclase/phosphodiesterase [Halalkalibacter sp. APA_J-10(15)]|uniref:putative bifunctional diguanylate cyclase/phosphodiesterase n=1 Tax=unclassified Halalkalibacter TaxID=2893063 RepID=UPI001FF5C94C|nr:EAL domain-containing protein [Halalkalibacter sp. APA_J-10(15)]MCK0472484.1 EAL domain-containing protein [Halalkalibacter sp. APA_J-10(15)]